MTNLEYLICQEVHCIPLERTFYGKDFSDGDRDVNCLPMYEDGLYCFNCKKVYGLSKLQKPEQKQTLYEKV